MSIKPGVRTAMEGFALLACAALGFQLLLSGRVHLFVGSIITTLLWITSPVLTAMGLWTLARAFHHPNIMGAPSCPNRAAHRRPRNPRVIRPAGATNPARCGELSSCSTRDQAVRVGDHELVE